VVPDAGVGPDAGPNGSDASTPGPDAEITSDAGSAGPDASNLADGGGSADGGLETAKAVSGGCSCGALEDRLDPWAPFALAGLALLRVRQRRRPTAG
jgi:MYXO-CTERM domain-containing protein